MSSAKSFSAFAEKQWSTATIVFNFHFVTILCLMYKLDIFSHLLAYYHSIKHLKRNCFYWQTNYLVS